jgi:molecular chaperone GrpE
VEQVWDIANFRREIDFRSVRMKTGRHPNPPEPEAGDDDPVLENPPLPDLQAELEAERERTLRLAADFDNFRKRTARDSEQRAEAQKLAFIREMLPVVDNLERALTTDASTKASQLRRGIEMTLHQVFEVLGHNGIEPDDCLGKPFDAHRHEAIGARFEPDKPDQSVVEVVQRGYRRGEEVVRPARVIINDHSLADEAHAG